METVAGTNDGAGGGMTAQRVPLSSALGQTEAAGVGKSRALREWYLVAGVRAGAGAGAA